MQTLAEICIRRPVFAAMLVLALVVVGATAYFKLGVDRFPAVDLRTIMIRTTLPGGAFIRRASTLPTWIGESHQPSAQARTPREAH